MLIGLVPLVLACGGRGENSDKRGAKTIMTYNVGAFDKDHDSRAEVAQLVRRSRADIVAFNELDSCNTRHQTFQLKDVADMLGWECYFARAMAYNGGAYGNGIASASPIIRTERIDLPRLRGSEPRSAAVVETAELVLAATHLDHKNSRLEQVQIINTWFTEHYEDYNKPVLLCGDMNCLPGSEPINEFEKIWERISPYEVTYPGGGGKCIDYIFRLRSSAPIEVIRAEVLNSGTNTLSDHFPVLVKIKKIK